MDVNITKIQEFLIDFYNVFNLSVAISIVTCPAFESDKNNLNDGTGGNVFHSQEKKGNEKIGLLPFAGLFSFLFENDDKSSSLEDKGQSQKQDCISLLNINLNQRFSIYFDLFVKSILMCFLVWFILHAFKQLYRRVKSKLFSHQKHITDEKGKESEIEDEYIESEVSLTPYGKLSNNDLVSKADIEVIQINLSFDSNNETTGIQNNMDLIFDSTLSLFLKQLDSFLGFEIQQFIDERHSKPSSFSPMVCTISSDLCLQSPRVRKKWNRPQDISPSILRNSYANEKNLRNWMIFENICKGLNWLHPKYLHNHFDLDKNKYRDEGLNVLLNFLRVNCVTNLVDWNISVLIVNYSLFLFDQVLKNTIVSDKSKEVLRLIRFDSIGSACNGTIVGSPNHFDVMFVFEFHHCADVEVLHNNYCGDIPPGHLVIGVNNVDNKNSLKTNNCLHKAQIQDKFGFYLLCNQIENIVDGMLKSAVRKLNTIYKYKMDKLPFRLSMSSNKNLELIVDTSLFYGMRIELPNIFIRFIPSFCIESPKFALLPKLYAVPSWRADHRKSWEEKNKRVGALSKLFPRTTSSRLPSNLLWNLSVSKLETDIRKLIADKSLKSNIQSCHEECLMILKALFYKGAISSYTLSTVVNFLLMESSSCAWEMSKLLDRVSDSIHFLKSAYTNIWLPNFVIHNPHLNKKIPTLKKFFALLSGHQQNILADVDAESAKKTVAYIDSRIKETGFSNVLKTEFSEDMWEYEFFLFG